MKRTERIVTTSTYTSDIHPSLTTEDGRLGEVLSWADANPRVYKVVMGKRSGPFGEDSSTWLGYHRGKEPEAVLQRLRVLRELLEGLSDPAAPQTWTATYQRCLGDSLWTWRARFTLEHIEDKALKGGLFKQFDGTYDRGCAKLDYTPKTLNGVVDRFLAWCDDGPCKFPTRAVRVNGKVVRGTIEPGTHQEASTVEVPEPEEDE